MKSGSPVYVMIENDHGDIRVDGVFGDREWAMTEFACKRIRYDRPPHEYTMQISRWIGDDPWETPGKARNCKVCAHWRPHEPGYFRGNCMEAESHPHRRIMAAAIAHGKYGGEGRLETGENFGCTRFQAKEEDHAD